MSETSDNSAFSFVGMEHEILKLWEETDAFNQSLEKTKGKKPHLYDGPPSHGVATTGICGQHDKTLFHATGP